MYERYTFTAYPRKISDVRALQMAGIETIDSPVPFLSYFETTEAGRRRHAILRLSYTWKQLLSEDWRKLCI